MIVYPAISPLTGDRHAPEQVIGMTGLGDRHRPDSLIDFNGIRTIQQVLEKRAFFPLFELKVGVCPFGTK
jgi:hypothetical protein